ncbi:UNVERIFIED: putative transcriptional regulator [Vibrio phage OPA17]|nr:putative transcriptional regulator [Vibrio phage OTA22]
MATITNLQKVILHAVATIKDCTGYNVAHHFMPANDLHWTASHQQVYRELRRMESAYLVDSREVPQDGKPNKFVYTLTEKGKKAYQEAIAHEPCDYAGLNTQATIHALFPTVEYYAAFLQKRNEECDALYFRKCEDGVSKLEEILIDRRILILHAECTFAQKMIVMLSEQQEAIEGESEEVVK